MRQLQQKLCVEMNILISYLSFKKDFLKMTNFQIVVGYNKAAYDTVLMRDFGNRKKTCQIAILYRVGNQIPCQKYCVNNTVLEFINKLTQHSLLTRYYCHGIPKSTKILLKNITP